MGQVIPFQAQALHKPAQAEPERWPAPVRAAFILGGSVALWALAIAIPVFGWPPLFRFLDHLTFGGSHG